MKKDEKTIIKIFIIIIALVKLPFIFHGKWDNSFFVPYMTDETVILSPIYSYFTSGEIDIVNVGKYYPPFLFNLLFLYFYVIFKIIILFNSKIDPISAFEVIYYNSRFFVLLVSIIGSYYYVKLFKDIIRNRFFQIILLFLINLSSLFFIYSMWCKTDLVVWGLGIISMYYGLQYWNERSLINFRKFFIFSILPFCINYYGYIYFLNFIVVSIFCKSETQVNKRNHLKYILFISPLIFFILNFELIYIFRDRVSNFI